MRHPLRWSIMLAALVAGGLGLPSLDTAVSFPVSDDMATYQACGRVFPDPHAHWPSPSAPPGQSPWAKGNGECRSTDFLGWEETLSGLDFLASEEMFGDFVEIYDLSQEDGEFADVLDLAGGDGLTAGLPTEDLGREKVPMYLVRVTDEADTGIPIEDREHFAYALSIHGIERAGVEGGIRAIEDLATWASCEKHGDEASAANCEQEAAGPDAPHPLLETMPDESITAGDALRRSSVWFLLSNPDGWRRGDKQEGGFFYQRYNGNGVDMNRDWPTRGYTFRPYTPWSEPETRATGKVLKSIKDKWTGGIDLHGQLVDRAFSFTLIGGSERPFDKDRRVLQFVKGAWTDAEERLAWSPLIKPNDAPQSDPRVYGVQWGTIWDTIDYTVTGDLGSWIDSPLGLDGDGIDNEMSLSHLGNCGVGTCYLTDAEQLHVDGNKSLIYAMMHYSLVPERTTFDYQGRAAYIYNPDRVQNAGSAEPQPPPDFPQQEPISTTINHVGEESTFEFEVEGPDQGVHNGAIQATVTWNNAQGVAAGSANEIAVDMYRSPEEDPDRGEATEDEWQAQNTYFNQSPAYLQGGAQLDVNHGTPGRYRIRITGVAASQFQVDIQFLPQQAWPDPGQLPYDVSNMDFFEMLKENVTDPDKLVMVPADDVLAGTVDLADFDSVVAADEAFVPGYADPDPGTETLEPATGIVVVPAPGAGERSPATSGFFEFDVEERQASLEAIVESITVVDPDLYLQRQLEDGSWSGDVAAGETGRTGLETLTLRNVTPGRYRLEVHNWAGAPGPADVTIEFTGVEAVVNTSKYTAADRDRMASLANAFVEQGGNLVLTDDSFRALEWMGVTPDASVVEQNVYAGHVEFTADGGDTATYDDPLAQNVNQPGAAEGAGHRHQTAEPVPTGYAIQDESGGNLSTHPQWTVGRTAFDEAGGRVVGSIGSDVTLGEITKGDGRIRILGSLLPMPTEEYDHPFGLGSYGVTYSGFEVFRNLLDWANPNGPLPEPGFNACRDQVPDSGFTDTAGNAHEHNIECIAWYEITVGTTDTTYSPSTPVSRAQMASFMARLAVEGGLELPEDAPDAFDDDNGSAHEANINAMAAAGIVQGRGDREYDPNGDVTRAQMASFIARVHEATTGSLPSTGTDHFEDDNGNFHEANINSLADLRVVRGRQDVGDADGDGDTEERLYFPNESVFRAQMASFIVNELGRLVISGVAHFGGGMVALDEEAASAGGEVSGMVLTNKSLVSLVADGCGTSGEQVTVAEDGTFSVPVGEDQSGSCELAFTITTQRADGQSDGQTVVYRFGITIEE